MKPDPSCERLRLELSARLDGATGRGTASALDAHLATCSACRRYESDLKRVRAALRVQAAENVPDLAAAVMERVERDGHRVRRLDEWRVRARTAAIAAAVAALLLAGVTTPWRDEPIDIAGAREIARGVRSAARSLGAYKATYSITEHNWHPNVPIRTFRARVFFEAPETFRMQVRDLTAYPNPKLWPANDVDLVGSPRRWWIREPLSCPVPALPGCSTPDSTAQRQRLVVNREPFDGTTGLPTDIVIPLETIASAHFFDVEGTGRVAGRPVYRIGLDYRQAIPLVTALQAGGSWRELHPSDRVDLWVDRSTRFPLRFTVRAGDSPERTAWARRGSLEDRPGQTLLEVNATSFTRPRFLDRSLFEVPHSAVVVDGGFADRPFGRLGRLAPADVAGLEPYRAGMSRGDVILSYADGMTWLKIRFERRGRGPATFADPTWAEEVALGPAGFGYYRPAGESLRRQIDVYARNVHVLVESNLARRDALAVASSLPIVGRRLPARLAGANGLVVRRLDTRAEITSNPGVRLPTDLPDGYDPALPTGGLMYRSRAGTETVIVYYQQREAEFDGIGIHITTTAATYLPPSSESFEAVRVNGVAGRYSTERNELEWIKNGVYRAVAAPSFDLGVILRIAESLK
ncbi:MAG: zf-HC2 domain-containing protein [Actinomycetota bacterium]